MNGWVIGGGILFVLGLLAVLCEKLNAGSCCCGFNQHSAHDGGLCVICRLPFSD